ncbi:glycosyltransferase family 2 protein [Paenibacillus qinlingensis]|uniref:GT2 family glycosyltransferase n=1 Tax=Paenibacillus qinlingensis TaxID=1837343 RepID=A0ABU1NYY2_9BACL|nr:glycosyltransferase family 2 protein [Paenibacillus qinlingensis]MDR6552212.1 GT2 family glycosyltransferase [Paenibacillus qinlingensis]
MDLSIIIVNYKTKHLTLACIESVFSSITSYKYEIILVDNASNDGTILAVNEQFPQVVTIANSDNVGFSKANNQGIRIAKGRYVLLLNSDTIVQQDTFQTMLSFMDENPIVGASGCKIVLPDGSLDKACKRGFPTPSASFYYAFGFAKLFPKIHRFNQYQLGYLDPDQQYPIDSLVGAFMLIRREAIDQVGMLDEEFFMYGEDIDWCYRIKEAGWVNYYYPKTQIVHHKGASSRRKPYKIIYEFHRAMILFHNKHYRRKYSWLTNAMVYAGVGVKFSLALAKNKLRPAR